MKLKNILLILIILVMIPEVLITTYVFNINVQIPRGYATDFLTFLINNPYFLLTVIIIAVIMLILYFTLRLS